jgi:hypothetical protein
LGNTKPELTIGRLEVKLAVAEHELESLGKLKTNEERVVALSKWASVTSLVALGCMLICFKFVQNRQELPVLVIMAVVGVTILIGATRKQGAIQAKYADREQAAHARADLLRRELAIRSRNGIL